MKNDNLKSEVKSVMRKVKDMKIVPVQSREPDVEVIFEDAGTRTHHSFSGYRPAHLVKENYLTTGVHKYYNKEELAYGEKVSGTIAFIAPEYHMHCFEIGQKIQYQEGAKITGYATITKIINKHLEKKATYIIPKKELQGSAYYEFQRGRYKQGGLFKKMGEIKLDDSLYLYEDDLEGMLPFGYFIENFYVYGPTYMDEQSCNKFVKNLREFSELLQKGNSVIDVVEKFNFYDSKKDWTMDEETKQNMLKGKNLFKYGNWTEEKISQMLIDSKKHQEDNFKSLDIIKLQHTAEALSYWIEQTLQTYDTITILGI